MKKSLILLLAGNFCFGFNVQAQRAYIRNKIEQDVRKKTADPQKEKGVKAIDDITYENDTRFKNFKNNKFATLTYLVEDIDGKGNVKSFSREKVIFGSRGECFVLDAGEKGESRVIFDYKEKANYMVAEKNKTATKMPLINMRKKVEQAAKNPLAQANNWQKTEQTADINGYPCRKYVYTHDNGAKTDMWMTNKKVVELNEMFLYSNQYKPSAKLSNPNVPTGFLIQLVAYDKKGRVDIRRTLEKASNKAEEQYFDMSAYKVTDMVDAIR